MLIRNGFRAISDDDFSRVTIAQSFTIHPTLDPSGTSWLPFPFWVYGGAMTAFGRGLATAEWVAILLGVVASLALWALGRWIGLGTLAALAAALLGACMPHAAYYGAAMVPDYPTAVLTLVACVTLMAHHDRPRLIGASCALAATLSRYETWPIAAVVVVYALLDYGRAWVGASAACASTPAQDTHASTPVSDPSRQATNQGSQSARSRGRSHGLLGAALIAASGAFAWMAHGAAHHGDALFFLKRVAAYRRALHEPSLPLAARLFKEPLLLLRGEPELVALVLGLTVAVVVLGRQSGQLLRSTERTQPSRRRAWTRPTLALLSLVAFLTLGDLLDGAPTHHEDRVLLSVWLSFALLSGVLLDRLLSSSSWRLESESPFREGGSLHLPSSSRHRDPEAPMRESVALHLPSSSSPRVESESPFREGGSLHLPSSSSPRVESESPMRGGVALDPLSSSPRIGSESPMREGVALDPSSSSPRVESESPPRGRPVPRSPLVPRVALIGIVLTVTAVGCFVRPRVVKDEPFVDRTHELAIGRIAASRTPPQKRVAVYTNDYGYFAVQAAMARPGDVLPLMRRDPRAREVDPLSSPDELTTRLDALGARYLIVPAEHRPKAASFELVAAEERFQLLAR